MHYISPTIYFNGCSCLYSTLECLKNLRLNNMSNYVNFIFNMYSIAFLNLGSRKFNFHKLKLAPENLVKTTISLFKLGNSYELANFGQKCYFLHECLNLGRILMTKT